MTTLVLGLGNPILTDDAVGIRAAELVDAALHDEQRGEVVVATASVGGLALMEAMIGYARVVVIDALRRAGGVPGRIQRLTLADLQAMRATEHSTSPHDTSLATALALGRQMGLVLPDEIVIYAVDVTNVIDFSEVPTPAVAQAIPLVASAVLEELSTLAAGYAC